MAKVSAAELEIRLNSVVQLLMQGASTAAIKKYCLDNYQASPRTVDNWIQKADEDILKITQPLKERRIAIAAMRYNDLIAKAYKRKDFREVRAIQAEINKLFGDNAPAQNEHTGKNGAPLTSPITFISAESLTPEQIDKYINGGRNNDEGF